MSTFSQAHNDHLDPDRHQPQMHPEDAPSDFTIRAIRHAPSQSWSVTCPQWHCSRSVTDDELAGEIAKIARDIAEYGDECGWAPPPAPPVPTPRPQRLGATPLQKAASAIGNANIHLDDIPGDQQTGRDVALGLTIKAVEALIEEATRVRRIALAAGNEASILANGGKPD